MPSASSGMIRLNRGGAASRGGSGARIPSGVGSSGVGRRCCRARISSSVGAFVGAGVGGGAGAEEGGGVCAPAVAAHTRTSAPRAAATISIRVLASGRQRRSRFVERRSSKTRARWEVPTSPPRTWSGTLPRTPAERLLPARALDGFRDRALREDAAEVRLVLDRPLKVRLDVDAVGGLLRRGLDRRRIELLPDEPRLDALG